MVHCRYSSLTFGLVLKYQFHSVILTSFPLSRLITENTEQIPPPYSSTSPLTTGLSCYLIEFLAKLFADFCQIRYYYFRQIRHCFQICHFWRGPCWHLGYISSNTHKTDGEFSPCLQFATFSKLLFFPHIVDKILSNFPFSLLCEFLDIRACGLRI